MARRQRLFIAFEVGRLWHAQVAASSDSSFIFTASLKNLVGEILEKEEHLKKNIIAFQKVTFSTVFCKCSK